MLDCAESVTAVSHFLFRYRLVKAWAAAHGLNDAAANTLNSWSLGLLVAFYLQVLLLTFAALGAGQRAWVLHVELYPD